MLEKIKKYLRGARRSWTVWFSAFIAAFPLWQPYVAPIVTEIVGPLSAGLWSSILAIAMVGLRVKTNQSLITKGY